MIYVVHPSPAPAALAAEHAANPSPADPAAAWGAFAGKGDIRTVLQPVQQGLCAYCEESLSTHGFHIDHVVPKSRDASGTFLFGNLVLSCIESEELATISGSSCGHYRRRTYDPVLFIKPTEADCSVHFYCALPSGELRPAPGASAVRANYMIRELNLNCTRLNRRRRDWLLAVTKQIEAVGRDTEAARDVLRFCLSDGRPFVTVVQDYFGTP